MSKHDRYTAPRSVNNPTSVVDNLPTAQDRIDKIQTVYEKNKNRINYILLGILTIVALVFAYTKFYKIPKETKAADAIFKAQQYFSMDSLNWALNGDGNAAGFVKIADKYSGTPSGNLANYYAGVCFLKKGDFAKSIKYLKEFDGKGTLISKVAKGVLGDAYLESGKNEEAISAYLDATNGGEDMLFTPMYLERAAIAYESKGNPTEALKLYRKIKEQFPMSMQARNVDKNLGRLGDTNP